MRIPSAIGWTTENKGLAGLGDLHGLPCRMDMEELFESYVEAVMEKLVRKTGGQLKSGRNRETVVPISWSPPFLGSQSSLIPDLMIEREDQVIIIDAKYKDHWEDLNTEGWYNFSDQLRERHRNDLLQVLAYASIPDRKEVSCCLMYPCRQKTWESLLERERHIHTANITQGEKQIKLHLAAMPFNVQEL